MVATIDFYLARVAQCDQEAQETNLANVKERCLRSKAAWQIMSDRALVVQIDRERKALDKMRNEDEHLD
ncbi:hypothetical protein [Sphingobium yanoikuyae]|uniref:hypothetical protein n=1 Tax=Sphingobium yanoikuyae TaxID=13690 RepID=UPI0022DE4DD9|nr:hypothetical protein [Sphingobium yanoikuyae]WBQ19185.1 hypothetical protein PAE53_22540 [Sphingobium yanoikuyae]